jgi:Holliday junction DNA helicase RuvB
MTTVVADPLRPASLDDVIGQSDVVDALRIALNGAAARGELPGHVLLGGPAGTGKTTLALCIAAAVGGRLVSLIGPSVRRPSDLLSTLMVAQDRDVIFIDEIHRMWRPAQEFLFPVMEDGKLTFENTGRTVEMPPLLFIGATTEPERLLTPMLDRFATILKLRLYRVDELMLIADRAAGKLGCALGAGASRAIAEAAAGVPRVTIRLVKAARDYAYADIDPVSVKLYKAVVPPEQQRAIRIDAEDVREVLASPAYQWRMEGREAG